jgi:hypothetical protein
MGARNDFAAPPMRSPLMELDSTQPGELEIQWPAEDGFGFEVPDDLRARVKRELEPGERLLWAAASRPRPTPLGSKFFLGCAAVPALFAIATLGFANGFRLLGSPPPNNEGAPVMVGIVALTAALMLSTGLCITWANRPAAARRMAQTCYAVTDRRAILWVPDVKTDAVRVISVHRGDIEGVVRAELPDGSGDLEIASAHYVGHVPWHPFGFRNVPDVRRVELIVRNNLVTNHRSKERRETESE